MTWWQLVLVGLASIVAERSISLWVRSVMRDDDER